MGLIKKVACIPSISCNKKRWKKGTAFSKANTDISSFIFSICIYIYIYNINSKQNYITYVIGQYYMIYVIQILHI